MKLNKEKILKIERIKVDEIIYNITTESGNLFANGVLVKNSGGLGTPAHMRVEPGMIHKSNKGVLFIDEVAGLSPSLSSPIILPIKSRYLPSAPLRKD